MNMMQHEQLFADLNSAQAETIAGGLDDFLQVTSSYGEAEAQIRATGLNAISGDLKIKDRYADGYPVYARFQGRSSNGSVGASSAEFVDRRGAAGHGTLISLNNARFNRNIHIRYVRLWIYQKRPGNSFAYASNWADLDSIFG